MKMFLTLLVLCVFNVFILGGMNRDKSVGLEQVLTSFLQVISSVSSILIAIQTMSGATLYIHQQVSVGSTRLHAVLAIPVMDLMTILEVLITVFALRGVGYLLGFEMSPMSIVGVLTPLFLFSGLSFVVCPFIIRFGRKIYTIAIMLFAFGFGLQNSLFMSGKSIRLENKIGMIVFAISILVLAVGTIVFILADRKYEVRV